MALTHPRYLGATATVPGDTNFWKILLDESDNFSFKTARDGKGGPFGAQLWLYHDQTEKLILVGSREEPQASNAVVSKGIASAHAEAESLSPENKQSIRAFLEAAQDVSWHIIQVSSGESCQSCRAKQVAFAQELVAAGLLKAGNFHVVFKATYDQTRRDAGFHDAPYDMTFRALSHLGAFTSEAQSLLSLEHLFAGNREIQKLIQQGDLIYTPVSVMQAGDLPQNVQKVFEAYDGKTVPVALLTDPKTGDILAQASAQSPSENAIISVLHQLAAKKRSQGVFASWDLEEAILYTNIQDIGPMAYAEMLWSNISVAHILPDYGSAEIEYCAREVVSVSNKQLFAEVAAEYNQKNSLLNVCFMGDAEGANIAHLYWKLHIQREALLVAQTERLQAQSGYALSLLSGEDIALADLVEHADHSSHYNGKEAEK